jgi:lantibiotic biosynthesis protein
VRQASWTPALPPALATRAIKVAREVADRLRDEDRVRLAVSKAPTQTAFPLAVHWQAPTLAQGDAGIALTCAYLDACLVNEGWDRIGHSYLTNAAAAADLLPPSLTGMFGGLTGLAFAGWSLSRGATRYRRLLTTIDEALRPQVTAQAERLARLTLEGVSFGEFDVISGVAGIGAYLLLRSEDSSAVTALQAALHSLVALANDTGTRPRWWTPAHLMADEETAALYPHGNLNCGLAHGIPGPLALMSLALLSGNAVPGIEEAIDQLADWLAGHRVDDEWGVNWPYAVSLTREGLRDRGAAADGPSRAAWCYGAPGVARALWLAGVARDRPEWCNLAIEAMRAVYRRPFAARQIDSPTFCHGVAGLLQVTLRFANDTKLPVFTGAAANLIEWLLDAFEPDSLLGYRN